MQSPQPTPSVTYYQRLGVSPWASASTIRQAYRDLSKRYHPDTSALAPEAALRAFQEIQEAYTVLSNPTQRAMYNSTLWVDAPYVGNRGPSSPQKPSSSERFFELEMKTRPLSGAEMFALLLMVLTFAACLLLVGGIAWMREHGSPL